MAEVTTSASCSCDCSNYAKETSGEVMQFFHAKYNRVVYILALATSSLLLMIILIFLGPYRRHSRNGFLKGALWVSQVLPVTIIAHTLGLMQSPPYQNRPYAIWAMLCLLIHGISSSRLYGLQDKQQSKKQALQEGMLLYLAGWSMYLHQPPGLLATPLLSIFVVTVFKFCFRLLQTSFAYSPSGRFFGLRRRAKLVADFMSFEHELGKGCPTSMTGYKYLVKGEENVKEIMENKEECFQNPARINEEAVTVERIWQCKGGLLEGGEDLKDKCLSFALFRLLVMRFRGFPLHKEHLSKTWGLMRNGLLSNKDRAFRVIEDELSFLYDYFYTQYPLLFSDGKFFVIRTRIYAFLEFAQFLACLWIIIVLSIPTPGDPGHHRDLTSPHDPNHLYDLSNPRQFGPNPNLPNPKQFGRNPNLPNPRQFGPNPYLQNPKQFGPNPYLPNPKQFEPGCTKCNRNYNPNPNIPDQVYGNYGFAFWRNYTRRPNIQRSGFCRKENNFWSYILDYDCNPLPAQIHFFGTCVFVVAYIILQILQLLTIVFSNWAKVWLVCEYVERPRWQGNRTLESLIGFVCRWKRIPLKPWRQKMEQYSLLSSYKYRPIPYFLTSALFELPKRGQESQNSKQLDPRVKDVVLDRLMMMNNPDQLTNGLSSLGRNKIDSRLFWACRLESITDTILVWHVATSFCALDRKYGGASEGKEPACECLSSWYCAHLLDCCKSKEEKESAAGKVKQNRKVAECLSGYCAYLVAYVPALLPDPTDATEVIFDKAILDARGLLGKCRDHGGVYDELRKVGEAEELEALGKKKRADKGEQVVEMGGFRKKVVVEMGAKLGMQLLSEVGNDQARLWKVLVDFWAEMMLFLAPSNNLTAHAESLANGGEFITHLWALLTHVGGCRKGPDTRSDDENMDSVTGNEQETQQVSVTPQTRDEKAYVTKKMVFSSATATAQSQSSTYMASLGDETTGTVDQCLS
ncbi:hypothetical protein ACLOJK_028987 [Asimina triloba]